MIDATELIDIRVSPDGTQLRLRLRDQSGQSLTFSLPASWLNAMLSALPASTGAAMVHPLDSWSMDRAPDSQDLVLTLRTPEGQAVSFAMKPWQVEGMATIASYGKPGRTAGTTIH
jgi:DNA topoisomerase IB